MMRLACGEVDPCPVVRHVTFFQKAGQAKLPAAGQPLLPLILSGEGPACVCCLALMWVSFIPKAALEVIKLSSPKRPKGPTFPACRLRSREPLWGEGRRHVKMGAAAGGKTNKNETLRVCAFTFQRRACPPVASAAWLWVAAA